MAMLNKPKFKKLAYSSFGGAPLLMSLWNRFDFSILMTQSGIHKKNGKYRARQRYLCKDCGKSFNDMTNTPLSGTRYPHKWLKYFELMVEGYTLPKIADILDIHISTAFYWRHKILNAVRSLGNQALKGIVESDETFFLESDKGKKSITHRKSRKLGGVATKRGISNEQICVVVAQDRNGQVISQMAGRGRIKSTDIDKVLGAFLDTSAFLCYALILQRTL